MTEYFIINELGESEQDKHLSPEVAKVSIGDHFKLIDVFQSTRDESARHVVIELEIPTFGTQCISIPAKWGEITTVLPPYEIELFMPYRVKGLKENQTADIPHKAILAARLLTEHWAYITFPNLGASDTFKIPRAIFRVIDPRLVGAVIETMLPEQGELVQIKDVPKVQEFIGRFPDSEFPRGEGFTQYLSFPIPEAHINRTLDTALSSEGPKLGTFVPPSAHKNRLRIAQNRIDLARLGLRNILHSDDVQTAAEKELYRGQIKILSTLHRQLSRIQRYK